MAGSWKVADLVGKTVWHWQFYYIFKNRQILAASKAGESSTIRHCAEYQTVDLGGLSIPDDLECSAVHEHDRIEIDLGDAHVVLRLRD